MIRPIYRMPALLLVAAGALAAQPVYAHGFGERYDLPVPLEYYLLGAAATVALSFVVIGVFVKGAPGLYGYWRYNLFGRRPLAALLQSRAFIVAAQVSAVFLFLLVIAAGILGNQSPSANFAPTFVWVIWWVGLGFFVALVGNLWALMNPWSILFGWAEVLNRRFRPDSDLDLGFEYPSGLGAWPAFALFLVFAWLENAFPGASDPLNIALLVLAYSVITWAGMLLFGRHVWLRYGEGFSVVFGFLARFAPTEARVTRDDYCADCEAACGPSQDDCVNCYACWERADRSERELNLRPWAVGLARRENVSTDILVFVILVLAAVTFDGFKATPLWLDIKVGIWDVWSAVVQFRGVQLQCPHRHRHPWSHTVPGHLHRDVSRLLPTDGLGRRRRPTRVRHSPRLRLLTGPDSPGLQHRPLLHTVGHTGSAHHTLGIGSLWLRVGPVWRRRLQSKHRPGQRKVRLDPERGSYRPPHPPGTSAPSTWPT